MFNEIAHWNWAGLLFVGGIFPAAGLLTLALRRWSQRIEGGRNRGKIAGGVRVYMPARRIGDRPNAIDSSNYRVAPHEHLYDLARSEVRINGDGSTTVACAWHGCPAEKVYNERSPIPLRS